MSAKGVAVVHGSWDDVLAAMERGVEAFEALEAAGGAGEAPLAPVWQAPQTLGPLPEALAPRARTVLGRLRAAEARAAEALDALAVEREDLDRRRDASAAYAGHPPPR